MNGDLSTLTGSAGKAIQDAPIRAVVYVIVGAVVLLVLSLVDWNALAEGLILVIAYGLTRLGEGVFDYFVKPKLNGHADEAA